MSTGRWRSIGRGVTLAGACFCLAAVVYAQPDPREMSGIPRPDPNLADGAITVRVIRGSFANNVVDHPVELRSGDQVSTTQTDGEGRATFSSLSPGSQVTVTTTLDGATIESQPFPAPGRGGVAVMLVGALPGGDAAAAPRSQPGRVTFGQDSRILVELSEESIEIYYLLDVLNLSDVPVDPQPAFEFDLPPGAQSGTVLQGSTPRALIDGPRVSVTGAFAPGITPVQVAYILPYSSGSLALEQRFPADFDQLLVFAEQWGSIQLESSLLDRRGEMGADATGGAPLMWGAGGRVAAGQPIVLEVTGLPHHAGWPRILTLSLSGLILLIGGWSAAGAGSFDEEDARRELLQERREKLFEELVKTERQHRQGKIGATRYSTRRTELIGRLERVLRDLDTGLADELVDGGRPAHEATA